MIVCWRMNSHSAASNGPGFDRSASGIAIFPMSCSSAARDEIVELLRTQTETAANALGKQGHVVDVVAQLRRPLGDDLEQDVAHLLCR